MMIFRPFTIRFSRAVYADAGLLREYIFSHYGYSFMAHGCGGGVYARMIRLMKHQCKLAGITLDQAFTDMRLDFEATG